jgi:tetratricopeptide (TPR) repeat protein
MPGRIEKTIFISYRRTNSFMARAVYQSLTAKGYDVFFDYEGVNSGDFEQIILGNLRARAHFLVVLTPSALERCNEPGDWLRREIEAAIHEKRNIIPLFFEGFNFSSPSIAQYLSGKLATLKNYNGLNVPSDYFDEAMNRLVNRFLNIPLEAVIHPLSINAKRGADVQKAAIAKTAKVTEKEISAEEWFEKGYKYGEAKNYDEAIQCYTEAIRLKPDYADAYNNRGNARYNRGDFAAAIKDYNEAIRLEPDHALAYNNRGLALYAKGDFAAAIKDYSEAIRLKPDYASAYYNRGLARNAKGDFAAAIKDYSEAIRLQPDDASAYYNRGLAHKAQGDFAAAIKDYSEAIRLRPDHANAYYNRALEWKKKEDYGKAIADYQKYLELGGGIRDGDQKEVEDFIRALKKKMK